MVLAGEINLAHEIEAIGGIVTDLCLEYGAMVMCLFVSEERFRYDNTPLLVNAHNEGVFI